MLNKCNFSFYSTQLSIIQIINTHQYFHHIRSPLQKIQMHKINQSFSIHAKSSKTIICHGQVCLIRKFAIKDFKIKIHKIQLTIICSEDTEITINCTKCSKEFSSQVSTFS